MAKGSQQKKTSTSRKAATKKTTSKRKRAVTPRLLYHTVEWQGDKYRLAKISKGRDIPVDKKIAIAELVCAMYETDQYPLAECLAKCGVTDRTTWYYWRAQIPQIQQRYERAQKIKGDAYTHNLRERALTALEKAVTGYQVTNTTRKAEVTNIYNADGQFLRAEPQVTEVTTKEVHVRPNFRAVELVLFNQDKQHWQRSPEPLVDDQSKQPNNITITIKGGSVPPVTSEQDIKTDI